MKQLSSPGFHQQNMEADSKCLNSELWHACAGPLVSMPLVGSRVVYIPQGHNEQVAASTNKDVDAHIPNYPSLPPQLICQLHNVTMHADVDTDEVYAQMTLQPLTPQEQKDVYLLPAEIVAPSKQPSNYFCKTLTASDTSTHGGFSVPRRAAEKVFPPLDYTQTPPAQELVARDLHDNEWKFRHIFRGQPKRHLLTTGWSVFVSAKRLVASDSVIFIWNDNNQLLLGIRRLNRPQTVMPSSVLSSDSMYIGLLAAAAHASATNSRFTVFYNPRASPSEFVIPLTKFVKSVYHTRVSVGMRFRMLFETEESSVRRYMGTITGIGDLDPVRWPNSHWRSVKVGWDESTTAERQSRVSLWEIEPLATFPIYATQFPLRLRRPLVPGPPNFHGTHPRFDASLLPLHSDLYQSMAASALQPLQASEHSELSSPLNLANSPAALFQRQVFEQHQYLSDMSATHPHLLQQQYNTQLQQQQQQLQQQQQQLQQQQLQQQQQQLQQQQLQQQQQEEETRVDVCQQLPQLSGMKNISNPVSALLSLSSSVDLSQPLQMQVISSHGQQRSFSEVTSEFPSMRNMIHPSCDSRVSHLFNVIPPISSPMSPRQQLGAAQENVSEFAALLPSFGGRAHAYESTADPQGNLLFGVNIDSSSLMLQQHGMPSLRNVDGENEPCIPFAESMLTSTTEDNIPLISDMTSSFVVESAFLQSSENAEPLNPPSSTFVKVYKSGTLGRSLDISKFSSYDELRAALAQLFDLEGQLEDPQRSGWQLVFVDRENDVLLLGDDPWQEFVNNVWYIKILSALEMQQMGREEGN